MNNAFGYLAVQFDRATELGFAALIIVALLSLFVSLVLGYRRGVCAGALWSLGFLLAAGMVFLVVVGGSISDCDDSTSSIIVSAIALVLVPNLLFALLGRGLFALMRRRGSDA